MPIDRDLILLWLQTFLLFLMLYYVIPILKWISPFGPALTLTVGPAGLAYILHKLDPAGKSTSAYLRDILRFLFNKKYFRRFERISPPKARHPIQWTLSARKYHVVDLTDGVRIRFFFAESLVGTLMPGSILRVYPRSKLRWHSHSHHFSVTPLPANARVKMEDIQSKHSRRWWTWTVSAPADITLHDVDATARVHRRRGAG